MTDNSAETAATGSKLLQDLIQLRSLLPAFNTASINERQRTYQNVGGFILRYGRLDEMIRAATIAAKDDYKAAIDDELVTLHLGIASGNAKGDLNKIIDWHVQVSLDPRVSSAAQALIEKGSTATVSRDREAPDIDKLVEVGWAAIVGGDIAEICHSASIIRADLKTAIQSILSLTPRGSGAEAMREALEQLEAANERVAANRTPEIYLAMIDAGQSVDDLTELDKARAAARKALAALPVPVPRKQSWPEVTPEQVAQIETFTSGEFATGDWVTVESEAPPATTPGGGEPIPRDIERFSKLSNEPPPRIPEGYSFPLSIKTTTERIFEAEALALSPVLVQLVQTRCEQPVLSGHDSSAAKSGGEQEALKWCRTEIFALCEVTEDSYQEMADDTDDGKQGSFARGRVAEAKSIRKAMGEVISERLRDLSPNGDAA